MLSYHAIMRFHRKALGLKHLIEAGPLSLPSCDCMERCGAPRNGIGVGPEEIH